jgi:hypothetical protein
VELIAVDAEIERIIDYRSILIYLCVEFEEKINLFTHVELIAVDAEIERIIDYRSILTYLSVEFEEKISSRTWN